jgi:signal transduction histidine kinase
MKPARFRGPGLAGKLLLTSAALLAIPWLGYKTLQATRDFLLQGQGQAQLLTAGAVANLFHNRGELFESPPTATPGLVELPLYQLESHILLDGLSEDWDLLATRRQRFDGESVSFELLLGQRDGRLYGLVEVSDDTPVHRHPAHLRLDRSDQLRLYFTDSEDAERRLLISFEGSGQTTAYEMDSQWRYPQDNIPVHLLHGFVERKQQAYVLEFSLPLNWLGERRQLGLAVADVRDRQRRRVAELLRTFPGGTDNGHYNLLVERSVQADRVLQALAPKDSRIWIVDGLGHVKASRGQLETASDADTDISGWRGLLDALQALASKTLLGIPLGPTRDFDPDTTPSRRDALLQRALKGTADSERRNAIDGKGEIIAAAHPIYNAGEVIGAVLVEKSTRQVLSLQRQSVERLAMLSLLTVAIVALALLGFAARLTLRIRRLDREADSAIDPFGRLTDNRISHELQAGDEIGDLARSFNTMLEKLHRHQQFLAAIPRTLRHEINNPLNTISTSLEQLEAEPQSSAEQLAAARRALRRIGMLVEKLSDAASLEQALKNESNARFDIGKLVRDYAGNRMRRPPCPRLDVSVPSQPLILEGSDLHIEQLLDKLIDNAIDFAAPGSSINIDMHTDNNTCVLAVRNSGPTILSGQLTAIFQLMHSARENKEPTGHFGLGLYVARLIAEFHGGSIRAENLEDAAGAVFTVVLPIKSQ